MNIHPLEAMTQNQISVSLVGPRRLSPSIIFKLYQNRDIQVNGKTLQIQALWGIKKPGAEATGFVL